MLPHSVLHSSLIQKSSRYYSCTHPPATLQSKLLPIRKPSRSQSKLRETWLRAHHPKRPRCRPPLMRMRRLSSPSESKTPTSSRNPASRCRSSRRSWWAACSMYGSSLPVPALDPELTACTQLFEGNPTLKHLSLWSRTATFQDNITVAEGFDKFAAQWYGLPALFDPIKIQSHTVTSAGNPIELNLKNSYTVKGVKTEQVMESVVQIQVGDDGKITKVSDKWNNNLPDGAFSQVRTEFNVSVLSAAKTGVWLLGQAGVAVFCRVSLWWPFWVGSSASALNVANSSRLCGSSTLLPCRRL